MSGKQFTEEFKKEAIKQISERGYSVAEAADRTQEIRSTLVIYVCRFLSQIRCENNSGRWKSKGYPST